MPVYEKIIIFEVSLLMVGDIFIGKFIQYAIGTDVTVAGIHDKNPFLNTMINEAGFLNGYVKKYDENIITKNMLTQVDSDE